MELLLDIYSRAPTGSAFQSDLSLSLSGAGYIVTYSIDDDISFENAKQVLFQLRLQTHTADKPIILVGNKMDLERKRIVSTEGGALMNQYSKTSLSIKLFL